MSKSFLGSSHKWTYIKLAIKYHTTPGHIYQLAHGAEPHEMDEEIMHELKQRKIIHSTKHHHHHHHGKNGDNKQ